MATAEELYNSATESAGEYYTRFKEFMTSAASTAGTTASSLYTSATTGWMDGEMISPKAFVTDSNNPLATQATQIYSDALEQVRSNPSLRAAGMSEEEYARQVRLGFLSTQLETGDDAQTKEVRELFNQLTSGNKLEALTKKYSAQITDPDMQKLLATEPDLAAYIIAHNDGNVGEGTLSGFTHSVNATKKVFGDAKSYLLVSEETIASFDEWGFGWFARLLNAPAFIVGVIDVVKGWTGNNPEYDLAYNESRDNAAQTQVVDALKKGGFPPAYADEIGRLIKDPNAEVGVVTSPARAPAPPASETPVADAGASKPAPTPTPPAPSAPGASTDTASTSEPPAGVIPASAAAASGALLAKALADQKLAAEEARRKSDEKQRQAEEQRLAELAQKQAEAEKARADAALAPKETILPGSTFKLALSAAGINALLALNTKKSAADPALVSENAMQARDKLTTGEQFALVKEGAALYKIGDSVFPNPVFEASYKAVYEQEVERATRMKLDVDANTIAKKTLNRVVGSTSGISDPGLFQDLGVTRDSVASWMANNNANNSPYLTFNPDAYPEFLRVAAPYSSKGMTQAELAQFALLQAVPASVVAANDHSLASPDIITHAARPDTASIRELALKRAEEGVNSSFLNSLASDSINKARSAFTFGELSGNEHLADQMLAHADQLGLSADERTALEDITIRHRTGSVSAPAPVKRRTIEELGAAGVEISQSSIPINARMMTVAEAELLVAGNSRLLDGVIKDAKGNTIPADAIRNSLKQFAGLSPEEKRDTLSNLSIPMAIPGQGLELLLNGDFAAARKRIDELADPIKRDMVSEVDKTLVDMWREAAHDGRDNFYAQLQSNRAEYLSRQKQLEALRAAVAERDADIAHNIEAHKARIAADAAGQGSEKSLLATVACYVSLGAICSTSAQAATPGSEQSDPASDPAPVATPTPPKPATTDIDFGVSP